MIKPPIFHWSACCRVNGLRQPSHVFARFGRGRPYLKCSPSLNLSAGMTVSRDVDGKTLIQCPDDLLCSNRWRSFEGRSMISSRWKPIVFCFDFSSFNLCCTDFLVSRWVASSKTVELWRLVMRWDEINWLLA